MGVRSKADVFANFFSGVETIKFVSFCTCTYFLLKPQSGRDNFFPDFSLGYACSGSVWPQHAKKNQNTCRKKLRLENRTNYEMSFALHN